MSPRSIYLRDQAENLPRHANAIGDAETQEQLRKLIEAAGPFCFGLIRNSVKKSSTSHRTFYLYFCGDHTGCRQFTAIPNPGQGHQGTFHDWQADDPGKVATTVRSRKQQARKLPYAKQREHLLRMARQLQTASQINEWLTSPALQPPK